MTEWIISDRKDGIVSLADKAEVTKRTLDANGFLHVDAKIGRTGIQVYRAGELGLSDRDVNDQVRLWRPASEVFKPESMNSFARKPVTDDHPPVMITAANARQFSIGWSGDIVGQDGQFLISSLVLSDEDGIKKVQDGKEELSNGYTMRLDMTSGVVPQGETDAGQAYDGIQRDINGNHIALVDAGRCGGECRIGDHQDCSCGAQDQASCNCRGGTQMADPALRSVLVDGLTISTTDQGAQVIERLQTQLNDANRLKDEAEGKLAAAQADHLKALETKDGEITGLKAQIPDASALDALVLARGKVIGDAKKILGDSFDPAGKSDADIKRAAVAKQLGDEAVKDRSDDYVGACFDAVIKTAGSTHSTSDPVREAIVDQGTGNGGNGGMSARDKWLADQATAWEPDYLRAKT